MSLQELPPAFERTVVVAFGLVLGSFLNVVIHRVPRGLSVVTPRSSCPGCGRMLPWYENVPVLSWLALRGRCSGCRAPISARYPAIEAATALALLAVDVRFGPGLALLVLAPFVLLLIALFAMDLELFILPDALTLTGTYLGLCLSWISPLTTPRDALAGVLVAVLVLESLNFAFKLVRGMDGFGAGDTKMLMMVGAFLGWRDVMLTLAAAVFLGTFVGVPMHVAFAAWRRRHGVPAEAGAGGAEPAPSPSPADEGPAEPARRSALLDLVPQRAEDLLPFAVMGALAVSFVVARPGPAAALLGALCGIAAMEVARRLASRPGERARWPSLLPLAGAVAGVPPTAVSAAAAAGVVMVCVAFARLAFPRDAGAAPEDAADPTGMEDDVPAGALPFGVFLAAGALVTVLAGDDLVSWYMGLFSRWGG